MKGLLSMIWLVLVSITAMAAEHDSLMAKGEMCYLQGDHMNAYIIFDGLVSEGVEDGNLFYNYANTALQYELYSKAIAYYEKALLLNPENQQAQNNLNFARKKLDIDVVKPTYILPDFLHHFWIMAILWWILLGMVAAIWLIKQKRLRMFLSVILMLITIFSSTLAYDLFMQYQERQPRRYAIVQDDILMYQEPAELSPEVYELSKGMKVKIGNEVNGWVEVSIKKVKKGWVREKDLILI